MATIFEALRIGAEHHRAGRLDLAAQVYRAILQADPREPDAWHLLGIVLSQQGQHEPGAAHILRAIDLRPDEGVFYYNLGLTYRKSGDLARAADSLQRAFQLQTDSFKTQPDSFDTARDLGLTLLELDRPAEATGPLERALQLRPDSSETQSNLGVAYRRLERYQDALVCFQRAAQLDPNHGRAHANLGAVLQEVFELEGAAESYARAVACSPGDAAAHASLADVLYFLGRHDEAVAAYRRAMELDPTAAAVHSNWLVCEQYRPQSTPATLAASHAEWDRCHGAPLRAFWRPWSNDRDPRRRLRLGFVSGDFCRHPVGWYLVRALEALDRRQFDVFCYSNFEARDDLTDRFMAVAAGWRDVWNVPDEQLAEQIRGDGIDILVDLGGHMKKNRLLVFARKPAPVQVTWIGYEGTTGMQAMDYLIADRHVIPEGAEGDYCERVLRLPDCYFTFEPPPESPEVGPLPAQRQGFVTFASLNNPAKITPQVVAVWAEILRRVPDARLLFKHIRLNRPAACQRYGAMFQAHGVDPARIEFQDWSPLVEMLALYNRIDLALDPFPFQGSLTTCHALWMGVPVVGCPGATFASRHAVTILNNVGLPELLARDARQYVETAVSLANDWPRLAALRAGLRRKVAESPLCDGPRLAANLGRLLREIWSDPYEESR